MYIKSNALGLRSNKSNLISCQIICPPLGLMLEISACFGLVVLEDSDPRGVVVGERNVGAVHDLEEVCQDVADLVVRVNGGLGGGEGARMVLAMQAARCHSALATQG